MVWMLWILWVVVLVGALFGIRSALRDSRRYAWGVLAVVALLAVGLRVGWAGEHFYGLEYEDAYVYAVASRFLTPTSLAWEPNGLAVCAIGSIERCVEWEKFPGHLMGLPAALAAVQSWTAFRPALPPLVGAALSTFAAITVWWAAWATYRSLWSAAVAGLLFAATPVIALYGGSACSESASSAALAVAFGAASMCRRSRGGRAWWAWQALVLLAVSLAVLTRRENVVLVVLARFSWLSAGPEIKRWKLLTAWAALGLLAGLVCLPSLVSEVGEYGSVSFGIGRSVRSLPVVLRALAHPLWFGFVAFAAAIGVWRSRVGLRAASYGATEWDVLSLGSVTVAMVFLYASHVRSAYQMSGDAVQPFDYLRYLSNVSVPLCLLAAPVVFGADEGRETKRRFPRVAAFTLYVGASASAAWILRSEMVQVENEVRREPALRAITVAAAPSERRPIATLEPLLVQIYGPPSMEVMNVALLTREHVRAAGGKILYLRHDRYESDVDSRRYARGYSALPSEGARELQAGNGWKLLTLGNDGGTK